MKGQRVMQWEEFVEYLTTNDEDNDEDNWTNYLEELQQLHLHPVNINTASPQQLQQIPLLSEKQIEQIVQYRDYHHGMHSLNELVLLTSISYYERQFLPLFLYAGESKTGALMANDSTLTATAEAWRDEWQKSWKYQRHEMGSRVDIPLYHRKGYLVKNGYRGSPLYNKAYYRMELPGHLSAGIKIERDAGERGIDSYGGYLLLQDLPLAQSGGSLHKRLRLKSLAVGDYKVAFGQGLVMNQGFGMGKWNTSIQRRTQGFRASRSTDEYNFMRGIATAVSLDNVTLSLFYSHRRWDATLNTTNETDDTPTIKSIVRDGYHRTETEYGKKGLLGIDAIGGNLAWQRDGWHAGVTGYYQHTDMPLEPGTTAYRQIYPQGQHFGAVGIDYSYEAYRWRVFGETSHNDQAGGIATFNGMSWRPSARYTLTALQRYYNYHYYSFYANALAECGSVQNETGGMLRLDATPWDGVQISAYMDVFYNPWPRYGLTQSSQGWDAMTEGACQLTRQNTIKIRYSVKQKEKSGKGQVTDHRVRLQWIASTPSEQWNFTTTALLHALKDSFGEGLAFTCHYRDRDSRWHGSLSGLYFHTDDYDSRIYTYEPNVTEMMYIPSFSGHGLRASGVLSYRLWKQRLTLELKYGITRYFDRDTQGSSLQTIYSPVKNDITLQARFKI